MPTELILFIFTVLMIFLGVLIGYVIGWEKGKNAAVNAYNKQKDKIQKDNL